MTYKMLVLDVDDTLLNSDHVISEKTFTKLMDFQKAGHILVLASGRPKASLIQTALDLKLDHYDSHIISYNGADVTTVQNNLSLFNQPLDPKDQPEIVKFIQANDLIVIGYHGDGIKADRPNDYSHIESELTGLDYEYDPTYFEQNDLAQPKFMGVGAPAIVQDLHKQLNNRFNEATYVTTSKPFYLEFMHKDVSKGQSLLRLCDHLGIDIKDVIAVGDSNNDVTMIETAGLGVAMGNATDELKGLADFVTDSNDEDGIIRVIDEFFS